MSKILEVEICSSWYRDSRRFQIIFRGRQKVMNTSKCPVCDWAINDGGIKVTVAGKEITVCCDECAQKAKENPEQYALQ